MSVVSKVKTEAKNRLKEIECVRKLVHHVRANRPQKKVYNVLLLTNRDSDNVGDQIIEACDISLISAVMENLNIEKDCYKIVSRADGIVSQKYLSTRDPQLLKSAEKLIEKADIIIFGGAPVFNYKYQIFYERTAVTLELAQKYDKPVIFSAVGVEKYDGENKKCQRLKETLNFECVKQITTRDDLESLQKYIESDRIVTGRVSDPAVFAQTVFKKYAVKKESKEKKKIGIFVLRANGFKDNKIKFYREDAVKLWGDIARDLKEKGYEYRLLTSGHFGDEAFLDYLVKECDFNLSKCVFNINMPEDLIREISSCDAVISCRLHPSIISFSFDVPSVGIVWNSKVQFFYDLLGYGDRVLETGGINSKTVIEKVEEAISGGVRKEEEYLISVYNSLFYGIRNVLCPDNVAEPYKLEQLSDYLPAYQGTTEKEKNEKIMRKFRRTYGKYNDLFEKNIQLGKALKELKNEKKEN